jgi:hypothetical protein
MTGSNLSIGPVEVDETDVKAEEVEEVEEVEELEVLDKLDERTKSGVSGMSSLLQLNLRLRTLTCGTVEMLSSSNTVSQLNLRPSCCGGRQGEVDSASMRIAGTEVFCSLN